MTLKLNGKVVDVASIEDAQRLVEGVSRCIGSTEFYRKNPINGCPVADNGNVLGRISYNSRFWPVAS